MKSHHGMARRLVLSLALLCMALPALPQTPEYTVEIVVFRNGGDTGSLGASEARPAFSGDDVNATVTTSRRLGGSVAGLNRAGLRVIGQAAWRQGAAGFNSRRGVSAARLGLPGVSGKVIVERGQYLHLGIDLLVEDGGKRYRLNEVRRVKADELHYFDHPAIGVLAVLSGG